MLKDLFYIFSLYVFLACIYNFRAIFVPRMASNVMHVVLPDNPTPILFNPIYLIINKKTKAPERAMLLYKQRHTS